jgi:coenzyme F420-reducing hydrogenase delta subunit
MKRIKGEPKVVGFYCSFGVHTAITPTQVLKELPENIALIPVPCISKINSSHLLKPFELGADRVVVIGCVEEECRYRKSDFWVRRRMEEVRGILTGLGLEPESINIYNLSGEQFSQLGGFLYKEGSRLP